MPVTTLHPLYQKRSHQWETVRDCIEGEDAIKGKGELYLPKKAGVPHEVYEAYKRRARWNNYTARNLEGLHGLIFRRTPTVQCSTEFTQLGVLRNIDRKGTDFNQFMSDSLYDIMQTSFGGFLVDMPVVEEGTTKSEAELKGYRSFVKYYPAESIINWGYSVINGVEQLAYVVLKEIVDDVNDDEFGHSPITQYRVLDARTGAYVQRLYTETIIQEGKNKGNKEYVETKTIPVQVNGETLNEIPFVLFPSDIPEKPMFYDLAMCNIGHYMKSADYENGVHLTTIPTGYITGHKQTEDEYGQKEVITLGEDTFLLIPEADAKVGNLSFSGVGLVHSETALSQALSDMAILGSRLLVTEKGTSESADSAKIHRAGENARLATFAKNCEERASKLLNIIAVFEGLTPDISVHFCTDYDTLSFDANALNAIANLSEAGKMPLPAIYWNLKNGEYLPPEMDFKSFCTFLEMQFANSSPLEIAEAYNQISLGITPKIDKPEVINEPVNEQMD